MMMDQDYVGDKLVELLEERFIGPHKRALLNLAGTQEQALARTGGVHQAKFFNGYHAIIEHRRNDQPGRVDAFYTNPDGVYTSIGNWLTGPYRFRVNPCFGHAVIKHGEVIEWWLVFGDGKFRLTPLDSTDMAKCLLYRLTRAHSLDSYTVQGYGIRLAGLTATAALSAVSGGAGVVIAKGATAYLSKVLSEATFKDREAFKSALSAHVAELMQYATTKQREFDELVVTSRTTGQPFEPASQSGYTMLSDYCVTHRFALTPGNFTLHYSGDDNAPFGNNQGTITFREHKLASWWYLGPDKKRLRIV